MPRTHAAYSPEFRHRMVELVRAGRTPEELAKKFEPSAGAIRTWASQADRDEGRRKDGFTTAEREEVRRLRRENKILSAARCRAARSYGADIEPDMVRYLADRGRREELLKLGIAVAERTVSRLMPKRRPQPSQTWRTFLANHVSRLGWPCSA